MLKSFISGEDGVPCPAYDILRKGVESGLLLQLFLNGNYQAVGLNDRATNIQSEESWSELIRLPV
jgi:hypothetical protein